MSCVIGLVEENRIYLAADGYATTEDGERRPIICNKIIRNGPFLMGYTGSVRTGQIMDAGDFEPPETIATFAETARQHLYAKGCVATAEGGISMHTSNFLIVFDGKLYEMLIDFQINKVLGNFTSIGSGAAYAMGAMHILEKTKMEPLRKLELALDTASCYHTAVGPPYDFEYQNM